jgi:hypothetical protein
MPIASLSASAIVVGSYWKKDVTVTSIGLRLGFLLKDALECYSSTEKYHYSMNKSREIVTQEVTFQKV